MFPSLLTLRLFGRELMFPSYGLLVATGFVVGAWLAEREAKRRRMSTRAVIDACFWALIGGLVGARLLFALTNLREYAQICRSGGGGSNRSFAQLFFDCTSALHLWEGGIVYYGGFAGAVLAIAWAMRRSREPFWRIADTLTPSVAIGHFFGRIGCFAAGCCFGAPTAGPWGVRFSRDAVAFSDMPRAHDSFAASLPLHPTQLYEAGGELLIFAGLLFLRGLKRRDGSIFLAYVASYPILRFVVEIYRGDGARRFIVGSFSTSQALSIAMLLAAAVLYRKFRVTSARIPSAGVGR